MLKRGKTMIVDKLEVPAYIKSSLKKFKAQPHYRKNKHKMFYKEKGKSLHKFDHLHEKLYGNIKDISNKSIYY